MPDVSFFKLRAEDQVRLSSLRARLKGFPSVDRQLEAGDGWTQIEDNMRVAAFSCRLFPKQRIGAEGFFPENGIRRGSHPSLQDDFVHVQ